MISQVAPQRAICCSASLRRSYAEISRFARTRHHGIGVRQPTRHIIGVRCLSSTTPKSDIQLSNKIRQAIDGYKQTIQTNGAITPFTSQCLNQDIVGQQVIITGYLGTSRSVSKKLSFALLRSSALDQCIQLVGTPSKEPVNNTPGPQEILKSLKLWTPVRVEGIVRKRLQPAAKTDVNGMELINDVEIEVKSITALNDVAEDIRLKDDTVFPPEQRHLQLRTNMYDLRSNLKYRSRMAREARVSLDQHDFTEVETPVLFKSTPEGAREFLVPTRTKGLAYALPQSPQQYKQILMASGVLKYYQFARCFRDEDLRADRQPEFTQLDLEMAFADEEDIMQVIEDLMRYVWSKSHLGAEHALPSTFPRMTYQDAMAKYGSDKPDLRLAMKIEDITARVPQDFKSKISSLHDPVVEAFKMPLCEPTKTCRKFVKEFFDSPEGKAFLDNPDGQPAIFVSDASQPMNGLGPLGYEYTMDQPEEVAIDDSGTLLVIQARKNEAFSGGSTVLGNLRLALHKFAVAQGYLEKPTGFRALWINDFPLFSPSSDSEPGQGGAAGLSATHHPFTAPKTAEDVELLLSAPEKAVAAHYDLVLNGVELGGGSRRIHNAEVQEFILRDVLKMREERIEDFRHLLDVLKSGCPPHCGIALGWDRLMAVMLDKESVRDVIAFPKSGKGEDLLVKSPNRATGEQWSTYHLQLKE